MVMLYPWWSLATGVGSGTQGWARSGGRGGLALPGQRTVTERVTQRCQRLPSSAWARGDLAYSTGWKKSKAKWHLKKRQGRQQWMTLRGRSWWRFQREVSSWHWLPWASLESSLPGLVFSTPSRVVSSRGPDHGSKRTQRTTIDWEPTMQGIFLLTLRIRIQLSLSTYQQVGGILSLFLHTKILRFRDIN